ncbi:phenylacetate degradation probable enoyl-CoA hydratase PaaB [compost metagenome]
MSQKVKATKHGGVLCIGLNRPEKLNAMDIELYLELAEAYGVLDTDESLRCGLLYGEGKHFTAGLELEKCSEQFSKGTFPKLAGSACDPFGLDPSRRDSKPIVVAAHGVSYTVALELMLAERCPFRQAAMDRQLPLTNSYPLALPVLHPYSAPVTVNPVTGFDSPTTRRDCAARCMRKTADVFCRLLLACSF